MDGGRAQTGYGRPCLCLLLPVLALFPPWRARRILRLRRVCSAAGTLPWPSYTQRLHLSMQELWQASHGPRNAHKVVSRILRRHCWPSDPAAPRPPTGLGGMSTVCSLGTAPKSSRLSCWTAHCGAKTARISRRCLLCGTIKPLCILPKHKPVSFDTAPSVTKSYTLVSAAAGGDAIFLPVSKSVSKS